MKTKEILLGLMIYISCKWSHMYIYTYILVCSHTYIHIYMHGYILMCICVYMLHVCVYGNVYVHILLFFSFPRSNDTPVYQVPSYL